MGRMAAVALLLAACSPATSRPPFAPLPQAAELLLVGEPPLVTRETAAWLAAAGIPTVRVSELDRFIETAWYVPPADSAGAPFPFRVKTRVWADPAGGDRTLVRVETVYRPLEDPSRSPRDLEVAAPPAGDIVGRRLVQALRETFEVL